MRRTCFIRREIRTGNWRLATDVLEQARFIMEMWARGCKSFCNVLVIDLLTLNLFVFNISGDTLDIVESKR